MKLHNQEMESVEGRRDPGRALCGRSHMLRAGSMMIVRPKANASNEENMKAGIQRCWGKIADYLAEKRRSP
jgi:hypothetical protein